MAQNQGETRDSSLTYSSSESSSECYETDETCPVVEERDVVRYQSVTVFLNF